MFSIVSHHWFTARVYCCIFALWHFHVFASEQQQGQFSEVDITLSILAPAANAVLPDEVKVQLLASDIGWGEGPLWLKKQNALLFSDIKNNQILKWQARSGLSVFISPSGHEPDGNAYEWRGANGLAITANGDLLLAQQGGRTLSVMASSLDKPLPRFRILAAHYQDKKLNSPNDLVVLSDGTILFTDPPYGLNGFEHSPDIELPFFGVFALLTTGEFRLLSDRHKKPNGIAWQAETRTLLVSDSDASENKIYKYYLTQGLDLVDKGLLFDARNSGLNGEGSVDGLKFHPSGLIFTALPGGIGILDSDGSLLARLALGQVCNLAFDSTFENLYITAPHRLLRLPLRKKD